MEKTLAGHGASNFTDIAFVQSEATVIGHPLDVLMIVNGLGAVCSLIFLLTQARKQVTAKVAAQSQSATNQAPARPLEISALPDSDEKAEDALEITSETLAFLEYLPEAVTGLLEKYDDKVILFIPADVSAKLDSGQAGILTVQDQPARIVLTKKPNPDTLCVPEQWVLPHGVDYVCSLWKMLSFAVGHMNTTRLRSTLANVQVILHKLHQYDRDKSIGQLRGNFQYLSELKEWTEPSRDDSSIKSPIFATQIEGVYRESVQSTHTYSAVLDGNHNSLRGTRLSSFFVNKETVNTLTRFISDHRADAYIDLSSMYCTASVISVAATNGLDLGLAKIRLEHASKALDAFERQNNDWKKSFAGRIDEFDDTYSRQSTKDDARAKLEAQTRETQKEISAFVRDIRKLVKETSFWISRQSQRGRSGTRLRLVGDGKHSLTRVELLAPDESKAS